MGRTIRQKVQHLRYLYHGSGAVGVARQLLRKLMAPVYQREAQYIVMKNLGPFEAVGPVREAGARLEIACSIVDSPEALRGVESALPLSILVENLRDRLEQGCIVTLACRLGITGAGEEVVGYSVSQRGVFSALGHKKKVSSEIFFNHYTEVLPGHRGHRVVRLMRAAKEEYCRRHGLKKYCSFISIDNRPSLLSSARAGSKVIGTVERVSILGGLFVWETPWERVEAVLTRGH